MNRNILTLAIFFFGMSLHAQVSMNTTLLGQWDNDSLPHNGSNQTFNEVWGYATDANEYAIMGSAVYIHFFDLADPSDPILVDQFAGGDTTTWRDIKTYQNRAYAVSDFTKEGLMIYDLSKLPDSVTLVLQTTEFFSSSHNIFIDEANGRLYATGTDSLNRGLIVLDIATDPDNPILLAKAALSDGPKDLYVHDVFVKDNIAYCSSGNDGFYIWDMNDPNVPVLLANQVTNAYNHSSWLSEDGSFVIFAEEVPRGLPLGIMDLSNIENQSIEVINYFKQPLLTEDLDNTPHNPFIKGNYAYVSYYEDGVQIWDLTNPSNPILAGFYDTFPNNLNYGGYWGCWGVYPFLPSGIILASDRKYGLHIFSFDPLGTANDDLKKEVLEANIFPNPSDGSFTIRINENISQPYHFEIFDVSGKSMERYELNHPTEHLHLTDLASGFYFGKIVLEGKEKVEKIVIKK